MASNYELPRFTSGYRLVDGSDLKQQSDALGIGVIVMPIGVLAGLANSQTWKIAVPYPFRVISALFRTGVPATTSAKAATLTAGISGSAVTGGVMALTSSNQATAGGSVAATAITAGNTGDAGDTLEVAASSVTAFAEGSGWVEFTVAHL